MFRNENEYAPPQVKPGVKSPAVMRFDKASLLFESRVWIIRRRQAWFSVPIDWISCRKTENQRGKSDWNGAALSCKSAFSFSPPQLTLLKIMPLPFLRFVDFFSTLLSQIDFLFLLSRVPFPSFRCRAEFLSVVHKSNQNLASICQNPFPLPFPLYAHTSFHHWHVRQIEIYALCHACKHTRGKDILPALHLSHDFLHLFPLFSESSCPSWRN